MLIVIRNSLAASVALLIFAGCSGSTAAPARPAIHYTHPAGVLAGRSVTIPGRPFGIAISPAGVAYVTQQDVNSVSRVESPWSSVSAVIAVGADPGDVRFDATGSTAFVSAFNGGTVHVIDVARNVQTGAISLGPNAYRLALSPDGQRLYVSSTGGSIYVIDVAKLAVTNTISLGGSLQGLAMSRSGGVLYVSSTDGTIYEVSAGTGAIRDSLVEGGQPQDLSLSPDDSVLYAANQSGWVDVLSAGALVPRRRISVADAFGLAVTPDGAEVYVTSPGVGSVSIVDPVAGTVRTSLPVGGTPRRIAFTTKGDSALVSNEGNWFDIIE